MDNVLLEIINDINRIFAKTIKLRVTTFLGLILEDYISRLGHLPETEKAKARAMFTYMIWDNTIKFVYKKRLNLGLAEEKPSSPDTRPVEYQILDMMVFKEVGYGLNRIIKNPEVFELPTNPKEFKVLMLDAVLDGCKEFKKSAEVAETTPI